MNKTIITLFFSLGLMACSDHNNGPDTDHTYEKNHEEPAVRSTYDHEHEHGEGDHGHEHSGDHETAPQTEAFYGDEAESSSEEATIPETTPSEPLPEPEHHHSHEEGEHDHHH